MVLYISWLPVNQQIQYQSLCAMHHHYFGDAISFIPPIIFVAQHGHNTQCPSSFANLPPGADYILTTFFYLYRTAK